MGYLMDVLRYCGFLVKFCDWVWANLSMSASRVLLNGFLATPSSVACGLGQGDPLSLLFIISIDPTNDIINNSTMQGLLNPLQGRSPTNHTLLYANDAAVFIARNKEDADACKFHA
jgi:hypothetical protein